MRRIVPILALAAIGFGLFSLGRLFGPDRDPVMRARHGVNDFTFTVTDYSGDQYLLVHKGGPLYHVVPLDARGNPIVSK